MSKQNGETLAWMNPEHGGVITDKAYRSTNPRALVGYTVPLCYCSARSEPTTWEQDLDAALQKAADQGVMVESVRANYIAVDDGSALLIDVHTEQTRRASK